MKRLFLPLFAFLMLVCGSAFLEAFELEISGGINSFSFNPDKTGAYSESSAEKEFKCYPYLLANVNFRHNISEILNFSVNLERDNVLQNSLSAIFGAKTDYINVNFGFFAGLTDKLATPDMGIIGNLELIAAKTVFLSVSGSSTLGVQYDFTSGNSRETAGIKLGFWAGDAVPSVSADMKTLSRQVKNDFLINDTLYRFLFNLDFLIKNINTSGYVNGGYQAYSRTFKNGVLEYSDKLTSYLAGFGLYWHGKPLGFKIGAEIPFCISAAPPMTAVSKDFLLFSKAYVGFVYTFE